MTDDANNYKVSSVFLNEIDFKVLIIHIPDNEVEDKLAYLAREKGSITRSLYEDFVIATCVANINQLLYHISQQIVNPPDILKVREELVKVILEKNPKFNPDKLIINSNYVVKTKKGKLNDDEKPLTSNNNWENSYYEEVDELEDQQNNQSTINKHIDGVVKKGKNENIKDVNSLPHEVKQKWWKRIGQYVSIKCFSPDYAESIFSKNFFHNRTSFGTYIVSICVENFEELFSLLDNMGIPNRVAPPILMNELYELCRSCNDFLTYENALAITGDSSEDETNSEGKKMSASGAMSQLLQKKGKIKTFKDISKNDLLKLADNMKKFLVGQDKAITTMVEAIQRASVGLKDSNKPVGSFLFAGRTGVGKTYSCKILANELIKDKNNIITIDCSEYSADHEYSKLIGCFVPGTKVLMEDGSRKNIEDVVVGDRVITHLGRSEDVEFTHVYDQAGDMLEITTVNSNIPEVTTKTHEILAIKSRKCTRTGRSNIVCKHTCSRLDCSTKQFTSYDLSWMPAKDLEIGDIVAYPRYKPTNKFPECIDLVSYIDELSNYTYDDAFVWAQQQVKIPRYIKVNEDFMRLAGYYVSEGGCSGSGSSINFTFNSKEHNYIIEVVKLIRKVFGNDVRIKIEDRVVKGNSYRIYVSSKIISELMSDLFGKNTYVKKTPAWFKDTPDVLLKSFLETAVFGDGCTVVPRRMDYSTVSETLHSQMELFFRRLGYITATYLEKIDKSNCKNRYRLFIGGNQIEKLNSEFNFDIDLLNINSTNIQRMAWVDENYIYKQIKTINKKQYTGKVYDLAVKNDVSYVIDFIVHNSPAGYVGYEAGGMLTNAITKNPFSVVVFDEVEKASTKVHSLLLQVLEEGRLTDGKGKSVSFKDAIVVMTSNVGVDEINDIGKTIGFGSASTITDTKKDVALKKALKRTFKPEFLNRIDAVISFKTLTKKDYMKIIDLELYKLVENLRTNDTEYKNVELKFDDKIKRFIYKKGIDEEYGVRPLKRCIEEHISTPLATKLLQSEVNDDSVVSITAVNGKVKFDVGVKVAEIPFYMTQEYSSDSANQLVERVQQ